MMIELKKPAIGVAFIALLSIHATLAGAAASLYAHGNDDQLYLLDTDAVSVTPVGPNNADSIISEIEQSPYGTIFGSDTLVNSSLYSIDPDTGNAFNTLTMAFPPGGDVITAINGNPVNSFEDLASILFNETKAGQTITLTILRNGQSQNVSLTLGVLPNQLGG